MTKQRQLISAAEVARIIGKDVRTVQRMAKAGTLPATKLSGQTGAYVFDADELERWLRERAAP